MATKEILDIVLRCGDEHVEPGFVHEPVEQSGVEGRGVVSRRVEHGPISGEECYRGSLANPFPEMNRPQAG
jgi:hypothetical protein